MEVKLTGDLNMGGNGINNLETAVENDGPNPNYDLIKKKGS